MSRNLFIFLLLLAVVMTCPPMNTSSAQEADTSPPILVSATAAINKVYLTYSETLGAAAPSASSFSLVNSGAVLWVMSASVSGNMVELVLAQNVLDGASLTVSYVPGSPSVTDKSGNAAAALTNYPVINPGAGQLRSASMKGTTLTLTFENALNAQSVPFASEFIVNMGGRIAPVSAVTISGHDAILTLSEEAGWAEDVSVSYYTSSNPLKEAGGAPVSSFTNFMVNHEKSSTGTLPFYLEPDPIGGLKLNGQAVFSFMGPKPSGNSGTLYLIEDPKLTASFDILKELGMKVTNPDIAFAVPTTATEALVGVPVLPLIEARSKMSNAGFRVDYGNMQLHLPISAMNLEQEVQKLGGSVSAAFIQFSIEMLAWGGDNPLYSAIYSDGYNMLASPAYFTLSLNAGGKQEELKDYGSYIRNTFVVSLGYAQNPEQIMVVRYDDVTGQLAFVPTILGSATSIGTEVNFMTKSGGAYALVMTKPVLFGDTVRHWAKNDIQLLASKRIADGTAPGVYSPDQNITRADFAKFIVKGMGLAGDKEAAAKFGDVGSNSLEAAYIGAASKAGIISGGTDGNFRPNATITREEMASMMLRAMTRAGVQASASASVLSKFADRTSISGFASDAVAACVDAGIMSGTSENNFSPKQNATRAQAASMIKRFLNYVEFLP